MALKEYNELSGKNPLGKKSKGTTTWLRYEIKGAIDLFNKKYRKAQKTGISEQLEYVTGVLSDYTGGVKSRDPKNVLGYGVSKMKKKPLELLYKNLRRALKADIWETGAEAKDYIEQKEKDAFDNFNSNQHLNWSYDKWKHMVDLFGSLDSEILHGFGYESKSSHNGSGTTNEGGVKQTLHLTRGELPSSTEVKEVSNSSLVMAFQSAYDAGLDLRTIAERVYKNRTEGSNPVTMIGELYDEIKKEQAKRKGENP